MERRIEAIDRLSQLSWPLKERSCLGSRLEPLMLNGWMARYGEGVWRNIRGHVMSRMRRRRLTHQRAIL
jgi:hypothetical protein